MAVETAVVPYAPFNGEELKQLVLREVDRQLSDDTNFKKSVVWHEPEPTVLIRWKNRTLPDEEVLLRMQPELRTWQEENKMLREKLEAAAKRWHEEMAKVEHAYNVKNKPLLEELEKLKAENQQLRATIRLKAENLRVAEHVEGGYEYHEVEIKIPKVEEPGRIRKDLEANPVTLQEEVIGRSPAELNPVGTDGLPISPVAANAGAVVGGGQRPSSVVGRPK